MTPRLRVERELVLRLASLLWRLRRATAIETGLLQIQHRLPFHPANQPTRDATIMPIFQPEPRGSHHDAHRDPNHQETQNFGSECSQVTVDIDERELEVARCFLGLADLDKGAFERLGRYEAALWRQVRQTIFTLQHLQMRVPDRRFRRAQDRWQRAVFDAVEGGQ